MSEFDQTGVSIEHDDGDEFVIVVRNMGTVGRTLSKGDAEVVARWLRSAFWTLTKRRHPIPEEQIQSAVDYWSERFLIANKRAVFRVALAEALRKEQVGYGAVNLEVDYDPSPLLLDATRAAGVECRGCLDSARGIFAAHKTRMSIRSGYTIVTDSRTAPYRTLWGVNPNESESES